MSLFQSFVGAPLVRRAADEVFQRYARKRLNELDWLPATRVQAATLSKLVRTARKTAFGKAHDFARIRAIADYQQRVPLRDYEAFWKDYWLPAYPFIDNLTWPGDVPYFALSSGTTSGTTKYIPVSRQMLASNRKAALTTLAFFLGAHPNTPLFTGRIFFLGGSTDLRPAKSPESRDESQPKAPLAGDLSGIAAVEVSPFLRPYTFPPLEMGLLADWEEKVQLLAERSAGLPITVLSGVPAWMLVLFDRLKRVTGRDRIADIWPGLRLVIHGGTKFDPYRTVFRRELGSESIGLLETYPCSEGFVAAEDLRYDLLRLIPDHGIFFEFVPVDELGKDRPARHTLANLEIGVQYAVVLTTCAGLWSYLVGDTVCFEKRDPPLLRFTGRTRYFLSAFGEHLISEEIEKAVSEAADATSAEIIDFHVGPVFPERAQEPGHHIYLIEFGLLPTELRQFTDRLDAALCRLNEDYQAHRAGSLSLAAPEIRIVPRGGFADWMRSRGQLGGQHKVPRMDNTGQLTATLLHWLRSASGSQT